MALLNLCLLLSGHFPNLSRMFKILVLSSYVLVSLPALMFLENLIKYAC